MGFFSWRTSDTDKSISNKHSSRGAFKVHMITKDGRVFTEYSYDGYGEFGGKDIYELIAELNGWKEDDVEPRMLAIDELYKTHITNGKRTYIPKVDFTSWDEPIESEGGLCANELLSEGFKSIYPNGYGNFKIAAENGIQVPKLVEFLPDVEAVDWINEWNNIDYPENCPDQGYFYE